jgi:hypothetical protein
VKVEGFSRMDISTSIHNDPKFKSLARLHPKLALPALAAYIVLLAESWREGRRLTLQEAWSLVPFDHRVAQALEEALLVDVEGRVPDRAWEAHFGVAFERRQTGRERQRRADINRGRTKADTDEVAPRDVGSAVQPTNSTAPSVLPTDRSVRPTDRADRPTDTSVRQSDRSVRQSDRSIDGPALDHRDGGEGAADIAHCPGCHQPLDLSDASNVVVAVLDGRLWHVRCPEKPSLTSTWVNA